MVIVALWLIDIVLFFLQDCVLYCMSVLRLFHCAESSPFCNSHYLFTPLFLSKQTWYGRKIVPSFSYCVDLVVLNVYRASNVWSNECRSSCLVLQLEYAMCGVMNVGIAALCSSWSMQCVE